MAEAKQVKSRERVANHGEVFTAEREVKAMCDLVKQETERIESRFLEPACGDGNFLAEILRRKLSVVKSRYRKSIFDYERYTVLALTSIYGVDILSDNAQECRKRLFEIWDKEYSAIAKEQANDRCRDAARYILEKNILCGNTLTMQRDDGTPIIFAEWSAVNSTKLKRRDFRLDVLLLENPDDTLYESQLSIFADESQNCENWEIDPATNAIIPKPIREYPLTDYWEVQKYGE